MVHQPEIAKGQKSMEIRNNPTYSLNDVYSKSTSLERIDVNNKPSSTQKSSNSAGDTINVSHDAQLLTEAMRTAKNTPDTRAEKVESLRAQVEAGTYTIDARKIAESMIREEEELFRI